MNGDTNLHKEADGDAVSKALNELPRVSAPEVFEQTVTRLVRARSGEKVGPSFPWIKVAVPMAALGLLAAFFGISRLSWSEMPDVTVGEDRRSQKEAAPVSGSNPQARNADLNTRNSVNQQKELNRRSNSVSGPSTAGSPMSVDSALNPAPPPKLPRGLDPNPTLPKDAPSLNRDTTVRLVEVVQTVGIKLASRNGEFVAELVSANSPATRAGVQAGDVVEAVNDIVISGTATLTGRVIIRSIRVRRDGRSINLKL